MPTSPSLSALLVGAALLVACSTRPAPHGHGAASATTAAPPLFDNLGDYHRAQAYFDQGLRLVYGFNHHEAQAAFREAARLDPACAMCAWSVALTYGSSYNSPTDAERERAALAAVSQARALAARAATDRERAPSPDPRRAEAAADRQRGLMPGAGHLVHMPSHIYYRVGRYADATEVNVRAVAADRAYFARSRPSPIYRMMYYPHNLDFVWHAAALEGREPAPLARMLYVTGAWRYARGLALLGTGRRDEAAGELFGLAQSLRAQGRTADATAVDARFRRAWARVDVTLVSSRF